MTDDSSADDFEMYLKRRESKYDIVQDGDKKIFRIMDYVIPYGKFEGKVVGVGFPIPKDFPVTPPYGVHVKANGVFTGVAISNVNPSVLGDGWQFWSRQVHNWNNPGRRNAQYYIDNVNRWFDFG